MEDLTSAQLDSPILPSTPVTEREVADFLDQIADMRGSGFFNWADDTLRGIEDSVAGSGNITAGQRRAIENIENSRRESGGSGWNRGRSRRYEGFSR